jgi:hypothetical protein
MTREGRGRIVNAKIWSLPRKLIRRPPPPPPAEPVDEIDEDDDQEDQEPAPGGSE